MNANRRADIVLEWDDGKSENVGEITVRSIDGMRLEVGIGMRRMGLVLIRMGLKLLFGSRADKRRWEAAESDDHREND